ncbi:hypothetical protein Syun_010969 [Stephania yunnanensis]|uniref:Protein TIFY n=1 Tax=Stephania yunnanensis TaxID=152371 RepID=A0AAP0JXD4_9MAGN
MAVLMMMAHHNTRENDVNNPNTSKEGEKPIFHDFLGTTCAPDSSIPLPPNNQHSKISFGGEMRLLSESSDLGSERQMGNHFEGVPVQGPKTNLPISELSNRFAGRKRSNSDSIFLGWARDRTPPPPQIGQDPLESSHLMRNGTIASKWERSNPMSAAPTSQNQRLGQFAAYADKISSSLYRDSNAGPSIISQPAADEGSRTGIKGSGILSAINTSSAINTGSVPRDRNLSGVLLSGSTLKSGTQIAALEPSNAGSRHGLASVSRQMTIFYAGQAHVFDDVHPKKADVIMALAGSNGGSWSTTYSSKSRARPPPIETSAPNAENGSSFGSLTFPQEARGKPSMVSNSSHAFNQGPGIPTTPVDTTSLSSGDNQWNIITRDVRTQSRATEHDIEGKRELDDHHIIPLDFDTVRKLPETHTWPSLDKGNDVSLLSFSSSGQELVPIIDLSSEKATEMVGRGCETWGTFQVINHGVSLRVLENMESQCRLLFSLPTHEKMKGLRPPDGASGYGLPRISRFHSKLMWIEGFTIMGGSSSLLQLAPKLFPHNYTTFWYTYIYNIYI